MKSKTKILFILICMMLMLFPGGAMILRIDQPGRLSENRTPASWPEGSFLQFFTDRGEYASGINTYVDDNFYYRGFFIRLKNDILLHLFGISKDLYIGEDDYLFYRSVVDVEQINNETRGDDSLSEITTALTRTKQYVEERDKSFVFLIPPQKNETFPERLPNTETMRPNPNYYQKLCDMIENDDELREGWIDSIDILRKADKKYPVYFKTDFHWNSYGATQVYTAIVNKLGKREGHEKDLFDEDDYNVYYSDGFTGGQLLNLPVLETITETAPFTQKKTELTNELIEADENNKVRHYVNRNPDAPLGKILFIGDSYTEYMLGANSGILDCFSECYFVHLDCCENALDTYLDQVDYVVYERIESGLNNAVVYLDMLSTNY